MAVYTAFDDDALRTWLAGRDVGTLVDWHGIASGIENSNFFVTTNDGGVARRFVLTVFERLGPDALAYDLPLMRHLADAGVPCPAPTIGRDGSLHAPLAGKPATLVTRLDGQSVLDPSPTHCAAIGRTLARMHIAGARFERRQPNPRGFDWWIATAGVVRGFLDSEQQALLDDEIAVQSARWPHATATLPRGPIHADLFRDNALFVDPDTDHQSDLPSGGNETVSRSPGSRSAGDAPLPRSAREAPAALRGVIDFYFAGDDVWLLDVAICLNDWCVDPLDGAFDYSRVAALLGAYDGERTILDAELDALPLVLRAAALRFWLSRLDDLNRPRPAQLLIPHDPLHFERLLRRRRDASSNDMPLPGRH